MNGCKDLENVGQVEELLLMTEQMQDELDQKDQTILELNKQLSDYSGRSAHALKRVQRTGIAVQQSSAAVQPRPLGMG